MYVKRPIYSFYPNNSLEFIHRNTLIGSPCIVYSSAILMRLLLSVLYSICFDYINVREWIWVYYISLSNQLRCLRCSYYHQAKLSTLTLFSYLIFFLSVHKFKLLPQEDKNTHLLWKSVCVTIFTLELC